MPNCDGFEVVKALNRSKPDIKKVAISGSLELLDQIGEMRVDKVLAKPLELETIRKTVYELFGT